MPEATEIQIAAAIVAELNHASRPWAGEFTAEFKWLPVYEDGELKELKCSVCPATLEQKKVSRQPDIQSDYGFLIDFQKQVNSTTNTDCNALTLIAEQVNVFFQDGHHLATLSTAKVMDVQRPDIYDLERLYADHTFETVLLLTVRVFS